jgi:hypothetical protein
VSTILVEYQAIPNILKTCVAAVLLIALATALIRLGNPPVLPHLVDQVGRSMRRDAAPIVVVGLLVSDTLVRNPVPAYSEPHSPLQLRKLTVKVENVLRGEAIPDTIIVYYFTWAGGFDGPRPLGWWDGNRRIFWLRRDSGILRTVCDGWDGCTRSVQSGAHPHYKPDPERSLDYALADLLLTRGDGPVNEIHFASQIDWGVPDQGLEGYVIDKVRHLALTEHGDVKVSSCKLLWSYSTACERRWTSQLHSWGVPVDPRFLLAARIHQAADNALQAADCRCNLPHGVVECQ